MTVRRSEQGDSDIRVDHWEPTDGTAQPDLIPPDSRPDSHRALPPDRT